MADFTSKLITNNYGIQRINTKYFVVYANGYAYGDGYVFNTENEAIVAIIELQEWKNEK